MRKPHVLEIRLQQLQHVRTLTKGMSSQYFPKTAMTPPSKLLNVENFCALFNYVFYLFVLRVVCLFDKTVFLTEPGDHQFT